MYIFGKRMVEYIFKA